MGGLHAQLFIACTCVAILIRPQPLRPDRQIPAGICALSHAYVRHTFWAYLGVIALFFVISFNQCRLDFPLFCRPCQVQGQQPGQQRLFIANSLVCQQVGPPIGRQDRGVELLVRQIQPGGARIVQVGQGQFLELLCRGTGWIQPGITLLDQFLGGQGNGVHDGIVGWLLAWGQGKGKVSKQVVLL